MDKRIAHEFTTDQFDHTSELNWNRICDLYVSLISTISEADDEAKLNEFAEVYGLVFDHSGVDSIFI